MTEEIHVHVEPEDEFIEDCEECETTGYNCPLHGGHIGNPYRMNRTPLREMSADGATAVEVDDV
jgi:hypothetical protein